MCLIIDANCAVSVFASPTPAEFKPIHRWINNKRGLLVLGGRNKQELFRIKDAREAICEWNRRSKASFIDDVEIERKETVLRSSSPPISSNDEHILALAIVSGARWLCCTGDGSLCKDFKNKNIISNPKGRIYKYATHGSKLNHSPSCYFSKNYC